MKAENKKRRIRAAICAVMIAVIVVLAAAVSIKTRNESHIRVKAEAADICSRYGITDCEITIENAPEIGRRTRRLKVKTEQILSLSDLHTMLRELDKISYDTSQPLIFHPMLADVTMQGKEYYIFDGNLMLHAEQVYPPTTQKSAARSTTEKERTERPTAPKMTRKSTVRSSTEYDPYGAGDYIDAEDFYEDYYDDFECFEDAEDYYNDFS